jgi:hypothetical protein
MNQIMRPRPSRMKKPPRTPPTIGAIFTVEEGEPSVLA